MICKNQLIEIKLNKGGTVSVYPEGAITDEGQMNYKFRRGMKKKTNNEKS